MHVEGAIIVKVVALVVVFNIATHRLDFVDLYAPEIERSIELI